MDLAPAEVYATLLDEGRYLCSQRTMYRLLAAHDEVRERRNQLRHPRYAAPEVLARRPNEQWSWDITKLPGPAKWTYFYLVRDARCLQPVRRRLDGSASGERDARRAVDPRDVCPARVRTRSADHPRRPRPRSRWRSSWLTWASPRPIPGPTFPTTTRSRRPSSKTLKYRPAFPERFGSIQDARAHCHVFFPWYNTEHHHSGVGLLTLADVHHGLAAQRVAARATVLATAYAAHPERFPGGLPQPPACPQEVWINRPRTCVTEETLCTTAREAAVSFHAESVLLDPQKASG